MTLVFILNVMVVVHMCFFCCAVFSKLCDFYDNSL